jgi:hypothetical protein
MFHVVPAAKKLVVGAVVVGALSMGAAGTAGAVTLRVPKAGAHFSCARADKVLVRIQKGEAHIAAGLPRLTAAEAKAKQAGDTKRADRIQRRITRFERPAYKARLDRAAAAIEAKCHVPAPGASTGTTSVKG